MNCPRCDRGLVTRRRGDVWCPCGFSDEPAHGAEVSGLAGIERDEYQAQHGVRRVRPAQLGGLMNPRTVCGCGVLVAKQGMWSHRKVCKA